jgi:hypothetical protein
MRSARASTTALRFSCRLELAEGAAAGDSGRRVDWLAGRAECASVRVRRGAVCGCSSARRARHARKKRECPGSRGNAHGGRGGAAVGQGLFQRSERRAGRGGAAASSAGRRCQQLQGGGVNARCGQAHNLGSLCGRAARLNGAHQAQQLAIQLVRLVKQRIRGGQQVAQGGGRHFFCFRVGVGGRPLPRAGAGCR